jgi:hypothetical protein
VSDEKSRREDILNRPLCRRCNALTTLMRVDPYPLRGGTHHLRTFKCGICGDTKTQIVDAENNVVE